MKTVYQTCVYPQSIYWEKITFFKKMFLFKSRKNAVKEFVRISDYGDIDLIFNVTILYSSKSKNMQSQGTEAIRTQIEPSKPKRKITTITNSQNKKITYGQPSEQLFPKKWPLSNQNRTKHNMNTRKAKRHRNYDTKTGNREPQQNLCLGMVSNELLGA